MVMLAALKSFFELGHIAAKLVLYHQVALEKQLNGVVKSGSAYPIVVVFHVDV
jgi:hypothetical protein